MIIPAIFMFSRSFRGSYLISRPRRKSCPSKADTLRLCHRRTTAIQLQWRTDDWTDGGRLRTAGEAEGGGDGGAKLLPAVGAEAAFSVPSASCLPASLPAHQPTAPSPLLLSLNFPILIYHSVCHVFAHPGLICPQALPGPLPQNRALQLLS